MFTFYLHHLQFCKCLTKEPDRTRTVGPYRYIPIRSGLYAYRLRYSYGLEQLHADNGKLVSRLSDKWDDFNFPIVK